MRHNLTTPGGFFVGLGGIVAFCVMSSVIYWWVKSSGANSELLPQQQALGLVPKKEDAQDIAKKTEADTNRLLEAARSYDLDGKKPNLDNLKDLRGVVRYRAAQETDKKAADALNAPSVVAGKTIIQAAMEAVADEIKKKPVTKSAVALMEITAADPTAAPSLPNVTGGGAKTMQFADPSKPAVAPAPAAPATPAPGGTPAPAKPAAPTGAPAATTPAAPAPARPPLINSSEPQK